MKVLKQVLLALGGTEELLGLHPLDHLGQRPGMVHLHVVDHDEVDPFRRKDLRDALEVLIPKALLHRVEEHHLFVHHEVGIVGGPPFGGVAVKVPQLPVHDPHPEDPFSELDLRHLQPSGSN